MVAHAGEFYDGENEGEDRRNRYEFKRRVNVEIEAGGSVRDGGRGSSAVAGGDGAKRIKVEEQQQQSKGAQLEDGELPDQE